MSKYMKCVVVCVIIEVVIAIAVLYHSSIDYNKDDIAMLKWFMQLENDTLFHNDGLQSVIDNNDSVSDLLNEYRSIRFGLEIGFDANAVDAPEDWYTDGTLSLSKCSKYVKCSIKQWECFDELLLIDAEDYESQLEVYKQLRLIEPYLAYSYYGWIHSNHDNIAIVIICQFCLCLTVISRCLYKDGRRVVRRGY